MFESLSRRLSDVFGRLRGRGALTEQDVADALREIRIALLEADVALPALKAFMDDIKVKAVGEKVLKSIAPSQMVIKIVHDGLVNLLTHPKTTLALPQKKARIVMAGLQGSGKTTMSAKIAWILHQQGRKVRLVSVDVYRPAAQHQLTLLADRVQAATLDYHAGEMPLAIVQRALAQTEPDEVLIVDTAGRLHVDAEMMDELDQVVQAVQPDEILLVTDALAGQDVLPTAQAFAQKVHLTGLCLSRIDGDSRGGAALSLRHGTGLPLLLMGTGEKPEDVQVFDPQRLAGRILDQGDVVGLVEKAAQMASQKDQERALARLQKGIFTLDDLADQIGQIGRMGGLAGFLDLLPGMRAFKDKMGSQIESPETQKRIQRQLAIIRSMTRKERAQPQILNASRKRRIAAGSGTQVADVNRLLAQYDQMSKMFKMMRTRMKGCP